MTKMSKNFIVEEKKSNEETFDEQTTDEEKFHRKKNAWEKKESFTKKELIGPFNTHLFL